MDFNIPIGPLALRAALACSVLLFLVVVLALLFSRRYGKTVIARFVNAANGDTIDVASWEVSIGRAKS